MKDCKIMVEHKSNKAIFCQILAIFYKQISKFISAFIAIDFEKSSKKKNYWPVIDRVLPPTNLFFFCSLSVVYICKDKKKHNKNITPRTSPESSTVQGDPDPSRIWVTHPNHLHRSEPDLYLHSGSTKSSSVTSLPQLTHHNSSSNNPVALNPLNPQSSQRYASVENNR